MSIRLASRCTVLLALLGFLTTACKSPQPVSGVRDLEDGQTAAPANVDQALGALGVSFDDVGEVKVMVENTVAFWEKIKAVKKAERTIDIAYFLFGDDYAGSTLGKVLLEKAAADVKIRLMVDAKMAMGHRPFFQMLVKKGGGNIEVSYFRPVPKVVAEDFKRLGLDPKAFVGALTTMNTKALGQQIVASNVVQANPQLKADLEQLVRVLTMKAASDAQTLAEAAGTTTGDGPSAVDALVALQLFKLTKNFREQHASLGLKATGRDWFDLTKWTHHKLLLVDGVDLVGGGRNLEDAYHWEKDHVIRVQENIKKYVFMDVDFHVTNNALSAKAETTFDGYLDPDCYVEPPVPATCETQIPMAKETAASDAAAAEAFEEMTAKAKKLEDARNYTPTYEPIHRGVFTVPSARMAYAENRMFPNEGGPAKLLYEEASQHNAALVALIDSATSGQDVVIQNAYVYFPAGLQMALVRAVQRGVKVTVISNSPESSDLGFVAQAARLQYAPFLKVGEAAPGTFDVYEYLTDESLHAKVEVIADRYLVIGSINADPRCEFLDTNNGVIIDSPQLAKQYKEWLFGLRDNLMARNPPVMRQVTQARIDQEDAQPTTDKMVQYHRSLKPLAKASFLDTPEGAKARATLQSLFLQY